MLDAFCLIWVEAKFEETGEAFPSLFLPAPFPHNETEGKAAEGNLSLGAFPSLLKSKSHNLKN